VTSPAHRFGTLRNLTREQCVAALLVGAVVVLLGFASGLGIAPAGTVQPAALPSVSATGGGQSPTASAPATAPPVAYVVEPVAPVAGAAGSTVVPMPTGTTTLPTTSTATPTPRSTPTTPPAPACSPGVLTTLLNALLPGQLLTDLGLPSMAELLGSLDGLTSEVTGLLSLDRTALVQVVAAQLPASAPAASCTDAVSKALPLIADGASIESAVTSVETSHK
jgi:hypothetical protein